MANVIKLRKDESLDQLKAKLRKAQKGMGGINGQRYCGVITLKEDPVKYQKRIRDEWG